MADPKKVLANIGVFVGIIHEGKLLLRRRTETSSILPNTSFKGCWELPGGAVYETDAKEVPYDHPIQQAFKRAQAELGVDLQPYIEADTENQGRMRAMFPAFFKGPQGYDAAFVTVLALHEARLETSAEICWVNLHELITLAKAFKPADGKSNPPIEGEGLLSGWGKRMFCMCVAALTICDSEATSLLCNIQREWPF